MTFRRPRVNVKPNVQAARPVGSITRSTETPVESVSTQSTQQSNPQIDTPIVTPVATEPVSNVQEEIVEVPSQAPSSVPIPVDSQDTSISTPVTSSQPPLLLLPPPPPSSPPPTVVTSSLTTSTPAVPPPRSLFRIKPVPNIDRKAGIHHRRPSASCSGTESETEPTSRPKLASSITFIPINTPIPKTIISNEPQPNTTSDNSIVGEVSTPTKAEITIAETPEAIHTPVIDNSHVTMSTRASARLSREYITQHISYRAQRHAAKVEPHMTIRKRRAATLEKLEDIGGNNGEPIDTSKLKIADFVHFNPRDNPMEAKPKTTKIDATNDPVRKQSMSSTDIQNSIISAPQLKIDANGELVVDEASLVIRNIDDTPRDTVIVEGQFNDDNLTHQSYRKIGRRKRWNSRDTLRFYQALRMCGTDFTLISRVFPNRDRDDIKRKFKTEDKANRTLVDSALKQRIPFDLTCFYSPSEDSSEDVNGSDADNSTHRPPRKRRIVKRKQKKTSSSDPLEINRRRERRLQSRKNSMRVKKSAEFIHDDDEDESSMDVADTVEVTTTQVESKLEQIIPSSQNEENLTDNSMTTMDELGNILGQIDEGHLLFVHNTDETGLDRIDVHVVMPNTIDNINEQSI